MIGHIISFGKQAAKIGILTLSLIPSPFALTYAADHTQLLRNSTLESAAMDKALQTVTSKKKINKGEDQAIVDKKIVKQSKDLESVFLSVMIEPMFPDGKESGLYGDSKSQGVFRTLMVQEYGKILTKAGGVGLAKNIEKQIRQQ